jgi:hypothetical protein
MWVRITSRTAPASTPSSARLSIGQRRNVRFLSLAISAVKPVSMT